MIRKIYFGIANLPKDLCLCLVLLFCFYCYMISDRQSINPEQIEIKTTIPQNILLKLQKAKNNKQIYRVTADGRTTISAKNQMMIAGNEIRRRTPSQRTADNGAWIRFKNGVEVFGYSAFLDKRPSLGAKKKIIRLIGVTTIDKDDKARLPFCLFEGGSSVQAILNPIGMGVNLNNNKYREFIFSCDISEFHAEVSFVSLIYKYQQDGSPSAQDADQYIPIEEHVASVEKGDVAVCVSVTYWKQDFKRVVEWVELNRLMGVSHITVYNNTMDDVSSRVFTAYANSKNGLDEHFFSFRQSHKFVHSDEEVNLHLHMSPVINDCMYRNMYKFRKIAVIDLDELIVPAKNVSLYDMLTEIDRSIKEMHPARSFAFRNSYHFLDYSKTNDSPLTIISHEMAAPVSDAGNSVKSIIDTRGCIAMHNHFCWTLTPLFDDGNGMVEVDASFGMNQHYKMCHFDKYHGKVGECAQIISKGEKNDATKRYRNLLEIAFKKKVAEFNFN